MPLINLTNVISCSSEDRIHQAENLLKPEKYKKWLSSSANEDEISCVLQLEKASLITSVDIGNDGSAFIELLVGKSNVTTTDQWTVLLPPTLLMTPSEARSDTNRNHVKLLKSSDLNSKALSEKWDRLKIICQQKFQRSSSFGLCFIKIYSPATLTDETNQHSTYSKASTMDDDEDDDETKQAHTRIGSFFAKKQAEKKHQTVESNPAAEIRALSNVADQLLSKKSMNDEEIQELLKKTSENVTTPRPAKRPHADEEHRATENSHTKKRATIEKSQLMKNVVFVLSGFQNPLRSELRSKATAMGATYSDDWDGKCTHLICAFANTPKFNQVQKSRSGMIVNKQWILDCHENNKLLSEKNYQFETNKKTESNKILNFDDEDENEDDQNLMRKTSKNVERKSLNRKPLKTLDDSDEDSSDEKAKRKVKSIVYDEETDEDEPVHKRQKFVLENFFSEKIFYVFDDEFDETTVHDLRRIVYAYDGVLENRLNSSVNFVVTNRPWDENFDKISKNHSTLKFVKLDWLQRCHDENKFVPTDEFLVIS